MSKYSMNIILGFFMAISTNICRASNSDFSLEVNCQHAIMSSEPAPVQFTIRYIGNQRVTFRCDAPSGMALTIDAPDGWTKNENFGTSHIVGAWQPPMVTMRKGDVHKVTLNLQDYFTHIPAGEAELHLTLKIIPVPINEDGKILIDLKTDPKPEPVLLTDTVKVQVREATEAKMAQRITLITKKLEKATTTAELKEIYHGLSLVPDARLMPLYLRGLSDKTSGPEMINATELRHAICRSLTTETAAGLLSQWLGTNGGRMDEELVRAFVESKHRTWQNEGPLVHAEDLWIKFYVIKYYKEIDQGRINGLKAELNELQAQLDKIISERESAKQPPSPQS